MTATGSNTKRLVDLYREMHRIRVFETIALEAHKAGELPGYLHVSIGQEAVPAGVCAHLRPDDRITSTHRGHGHALAKGSDLNAMMAELYGRATGACRGKGGSMHIADFNVGMLGANGIVAGGIPIACGAAQGLRILGSDAIVACFFGDGAINRGPFLEGLNWAAIYKLPVLFVCEDNTFSAFTHSSTTTAGPGALVRSESCGVPGITIDGNDAVSVDATAEELIARIRRGEGPQMLHARTYRFEGHTSTDPATYRKAEDLAAAKARDPLTRLQSVLESMGFGETERVALENSTIAEMRAAQDAARAAPWPEAHVAFEDIQDEGAPAWH